MPTTNLACPAKVNLSLSIGSPLPSGMHPLSSWMVALDFADTLTLSPLAEGLSSKFEMAYAPDAPKPCPIDWPIEKDLGFRAHKLLQEHTRRPLPVHYALQKRIPTGAGLGGGSSNAAAALVGLNNAFNLNLPKDTLISLGQKLGSDVGFLIGALLGAPSAIVSGLGEKLETIPLKNPIHLALIFPSFGCPTGPVYGAFDRLHNYKAGNPLVPSQDARVKAMALSQSITPDAPFNDLAQPACIVAPGLGELQARLQQTLGTPVHITGSGSTLFTIARNAASAQSLAQSAARAAQLPAIATHTT
jgi:4-diphosphocytidyl-2-C-methyl-D-erythritol kinase